MEWRVSAILTTYNRPDMAVRALKSILSQSKPPEEIIIVDDAGSVDLFQQLASFGEERIRYIRHDSNQGLAAARNSGIRAATGKFVGFLDDDDEWLPQRLESQYERYSKLSRNDKEYLACLQVGCVFVDQGGEKIGQSMPLNHGDLSESIRTNGAVTPSSSFLFLRSAIEAVGGFDEVLLSGIDHDIWMSLAVAGYSSEAIPEPLVRIYCDHRETMMTDASKRIEGLDQYIAKWAPTYKEWYGPIGGARYAKSYFAKVIGRLVSDKVSQGQWADARTAFVAIVNRVGWDLRIMTAVLILITKKQIVRFAPWILKGTGNS